MRLELLALDEISDVFRVSDLVLAVISISVTTDVLHRDLRQLVATRVVDDGTTVHVDVLERHPHSAHVAGGHRVEVEGVRVGRLHGSHPEVESLERQGLTTIDRLQYRQDLGRESESLDVWVDLPKIHDASARVVDAVRLQAILPLVPAFQIRDDSVEDRL